MNTKKKKLLLMLSKNGSTSIPPLNLLEFDVTSTTISAGAMTNVIGGDWSVSRNSVASYRPTPSTSQDVGVNIARIEGGKVLIELQSTNDIPNSSDLTSLLTSNVTLTVNNVTAPDGTVTGGKLDLLDNAFGLYFTDNIVWTTGEQKSYSIWARADSNLDIYIGTNGVTKIFNNTSLLVNLTTSWQLINIDFTVGDNEANGGHCTIATSDLSINTNNLTARTVYIWRPQWEKTLTFTSNIPTTGTTVTRQADVITITVPVGATQSETWIDGVSQGVVGVTAGDTFTMVNGTTKIIMN